MIDAGKFIANFPKALSPKGIRQSQIVGFTRLIKYWNFHTELSDIRFLACILGNIWHESATTMQPIEEWGKGNGKPYGKPDPITQKTYFGRGDIMLTWKENYKKFSKITGVDLVLHPELALDPSVSACIAFEGMIRGLFTGKKLSDYFNDTQEDWLNSRRIVNSLDRAELIASYGHLFHDLLKISKQDLV
jgi:putative chitinase